MLRKVLPLLAFGIVLAGCHSKPSTDASIAPVTVQNDTQYDEANREAHQLAGPIVPFVHARTDLTAAQIEDLKKAIRLYSGMYQYRPTQAAPLLASGEVFQLLGDDSTAIQKLRQYIVSIAPNASKAALVTEADSYMLISKSEFNLKEYDAAVQDATAAIKMFPKTAEYYVTRASAYTQLKKQALAIKDVNTALKYDPTNQHAIELLKILQD